MATAHRPLRLHDRAPPAVSDSRPSHRTSVRSMDRHSAPLPAPTQDPDPGSKTEDRVAVEVETESAPAGRRGQPGGRTVSPEDGWGVRLDPVAGAGIGRRVIVVVNPA